MEERILFGGLIAEQQDGRHGCSATVSFYRPSVLWIGDRLGTACLDLVIDAVVLIRGSGVVGSIVVASHGSVAR